MLQSDAAQRAYADAGLVFVQGWVPYRYAKRVQAAIEEHRERAERIRVEATRARAKKGQRR